MKTLVVNNQKGGVGKTMLAVHAAWYLAEAGAKVLVVDLDPQANAAHSLANARLVGVSSALFFDPAVTFRSQAGVNLMAGDRRLDSVDAQLSGAVRQFRQGFARAGESFDYCVIDTPPTWSGRNYAALMVASSLVTPIELELYSIQGVKQVLSQKSAVERHARQGRPIDFLGLLPSRFQSTSPRQRDNLKALLGQGGGLMFPGQGLLTQRQGFAEALDQKTPVWTLPKIAAQVAGREIRSVLGDIKGRLDSLPD